MLHSSCRQLTRTDQAPNRTPNPPNRTPPIPMSKKRKRSKPSATTPSSVSLETLFAAPPQGPAQESKAQTAGRQSRGSRTWPSRIPGEKHVFRERAPSPPAPRRGYREPSRVGPDRLERDPLLHQASALKRYSPSALFRARYREEHLLNISPKAIVLKRGLNDD